MQVYVSVYACVTDIHKEKIERYRQGERVRDRDKKRQAVDKVDRARKRLR